MTHKICKNCGETLDRFIFDGVFEEWIWNGESWECERNSLLDDLQLKVKCPNCYSIIGIGSDFISIN